MNLKLSLIFTKYIQLFFINLCYCTNIMIKQIILYINLMLLIQDEI